RLRIRTSNWEDIAWAADGETNVFFTSMSSLPWSDYPWPPIQAVNNRQQKKRNDQQHKCRLVRAGILRVLHLVVNINRDGAGDAGNVAADHEDNAEFAQGVREAQREPRDQPGFREWKHDAAKCLNRRMSQRCRGAQQRGIYRAKCRGERLHGEWQAIEQRSDHQSFESEGQGMAGQ